MVEKLQFSDKFVEFRVRRSMCFCNTLLHLDINRVGRSNWGGIPECGRSPLNSLVAIYHYGKLSIPRLSNIPLLSEYPCPYIIIKAIKRLLLHRRVYQKRKASSLCDVDLFEDTAQLGSESEFGQDYKTSPHQLQLLEHHDKQAKN